MSDINGSIKKESTLMKGLKLFIDIPEGVSIKSYILKSTVECIKRTVVDIINMAFFQTPPATHVGQGVNKVKVSFNQGVNEQTKYNSPVRKPQPQSVSNYKFDGILLPSSQQATDLLELMKATITNGDGCLTISELYGLANIEIDKASSNPFDGIYGWKDVSTAYPRPYNSGGVEYWEIVLPKPIRVK